MTKEESTDQFKQSYFMRLEAMKAFQAGKVSAIAAPETAQAAIPDVTRGESPVIPDVTRGMSLVILDVTRGESPVIPDVTIGEYPVIPDVTRGESPV